MAIFMERLRKAEAELAPTETGDPWRLPLERLRGKIGDDGIERITTQLLFDILEVPQRSRGAGACPGAHSRGLSGAGAWLLPPANAPYLMSAPQTGCTLSASLGATTDTKRWALLCPSTRLAG